MAAELLDRLDFAGTKTDTAANNSMRWPRTNACDRDGEEIDKDTVPQDIKDAQSRLALDLLISDRITDADSAGASFKSVTVGPIEIENFSESDGGAAGDSVNPVPTNVLNMISHLIGSGTSVYQLSVYK